MLLCQYFWGIRIKNEHFKNNFVIHNVASRKDIIMSEEIKEELKQKTDKKCECTGKCIKVFLLGIFASFLGCLLALLIFGAATKPKMPPAPMMFGPPQAQQSQMFHHGKFKHGEFKGPESGFPHKFRGEKFKKNFDEKMIPKGPRPDFDED